jgi:hypothetical protein
VRNLAASLADENGDVIMDGLKLAKLAGRGGN